MKIKKIQKQKDNKYKLIMDGGDTLITYDDVILKHQLLYNKDISNEFYSELSKDTLYYSFYNKVLKFIQKRIRSKKEIIDYLEKNNISDEFSSKIIDTLMKNGFINDEKFCKAYIYDKIYLSSIGPNKIYKELIEHRIDDSIIKRYLDEIDDDVIYNHLYKLIDKKIKQNHKYSRSILKQKIISYYLEQGYLKEMISLIFDELYEEDITIIDKEYRKLKDKLSKKYKDKELEYQLVSKLYQKGFLKEEIDKIKESF